MSDLLKLLADVPAFYFFAGYAALGVVCTFFMARFMSVARQLDGEGEQ